VTATAVGLEGLLREAASGATDVDAGRTPADLLVRSVSASGVFDAELDALLAGRQADDVRASAGVISELATECLSTAFGTWAHRMVADYLARGRQTPATSEALGRLRAGSAIGATGMAQGLKSLAGLGEVGITATPDAGGYRVDGTIGWISNLADDAVVVLPAVTPTGTGIVAWVPLSAPGITARPVSGLLALDATASGSLRLAGVHVPADQVLSDDLAGFARRFKRTFLILQTSFALGVVRRSRIEIDRALDRGENAVFGAEASALARDVDAFTEAWTRLARDVAAHDVREYLTTRLEVSRLAQRATRLELTLAGGRGYQVAAGANRRFREAAFLPVQSPSEGHLLWELSSLA